VHERGKQVGLLPRGRNRVFAPAIQSVKDDLPSVECLPIESQLEEHGHPTDMGAQGLQVLAAGHVPCVGSFGHAQRSAELTVRRVRLTADVRGTRHGGGRPDQVRQVRAECSQPLRLTRIAVCQPVGEVEQTF
jgi:hypothetical protein